MKNDIDTDFPSGHDAGGEVQSRMDGMAENTELGRREFFRLALGFAGTMLAVNVATGMKIFKVVDAEAREIVTNSLPLSWKIRKAVWNGFLGLKYKGAKPTPIPVPIGRSRTIKLIPFKQYYPSIPISNVLVADHVPRDETQPLKRRVIALQLWLSEKYPSMQDGLPQVPENPDKKLEEAYSGYRRGLFPPPEIPDALKMTDPARMLGRLAVEGPFSGYLDKSERGFQWDLMYLNKADFILHEGLEKIGSRVEFAIDETSKSLYAKTIETAQGRCKPGDQGWLNAVRLVLCALSNDIAIVRHFNWIHLVSGSIFALVTRNRLGANHPIRRLLWPHTYGTQYSNDMVTEPQMASFGDFVNMFSFTSEGVNALFDWTYSRYRIETVHPRLDAARRGISDVVFDTPSQKNLETLFDTFLRHTSRYVETYYPEDQILQTDAEVSGWLADMHTLIPNGIGTVGKGKPIRQRVAELCASIIYLGSVQHEMLGSSLWNYQPWTHVIPCRVYSSGQREPVDVYQRLLNSNFILQTSRIPIMQDFTYLAIDEKGKEIFKQFRAELEDLNQEMRQQPNVEWKIYPDILEANINA